MLYTPFGFRYKNQSISQSFTTVQIQSYPWNPALIGYQNDLCASLIGVDQVLSNRSSFGYVYPVPFATGGGTVFFSPLLGVIQSFTFRGNDKVMKLNVPNFTPGDELSGETVTVNVITDRGAIYEVQASGSAIPIENGTFTPYDLNPALEFDQEFLAADNVTEVTAQFTQGSATTGSKQGILINANVNAASELLNNIPSSICVVLGLSDGYEGNTYGNDNLIFDVVLSNFWFNRCSPFAT